MAVINFTDSPIPPAITSVATDASTKDAANAARSKQKELANRVQSWYEKFFSSVTVIASLGAGFTFSLVLSPVSETKNIHFRPEDVTTFVSLSWLFFTLALALSTSLQLWSALYTDYLTDLLVDRQGTIFILLNIVSWLVQSLLLFGFLFASFCVTAFQEVVGYVALGLTAFFMCLLITPIWWKIGVSSAFTTRDPLTVSDWIVAAGQ